MGRRPSKARAFTLVDLLVVVGIIGVLIEILLPAISRARTASRRVVCLSVFFSSRRRHTRCSRDWSSDVCSSDLNAVAFVAMFVIGGLSGIYMAATPVDMFIHDTYFIVAHLHYVLFGGSLFALFGAIVYWYPKMFGRMMSERWGKVHFWLTFILYNCVFFPMHILGMGGMMRRLYDPSQYTFLQPYQPMNVFISISAFLLFATQIIFFVNFWWSLKKGKPAPQNPWHDNGLEWSLPSPAPHGNREKVPTVYPGPSDLP